MRKITSDDAVLSGKLMRLGFRPTTVFNSMKEYGGRAFGKKFTIAERNMNMMVGKAEDLGPTYAAHDLLIVRHDRSFLVKRPA